MKDTTLSIPKSDLEIIIAKFYRLKDVSITTANTGPIGWYIESLTVEANFPKKRRKK